MKNLDFFKKQAKYLVEDWKTRTANPGLDDEFEGEPYVFKSKHFDMYNVSNFFEIGDDFSLQKAQHIIAQMAGFKKWDELIASNEDELSIARIRFMHLDPSDAAEWELYCKNIKWDLTPLESKFLVIKQQMYNTKSNFLKNSQFKNEILYGKEREVALYKELSIFPNHSNPETEVECIHCSRKYLNKELTVIHEYNFGFVGEHDSIACKYYPECDGTLIDLMPTGNN